jgi:hypothetical protein
MSQDEHDKIASWNIYQKILETKYPKPDDKQLQLREKVWKRKNEEGMRKVRIEFFQ